MPLLCLEGPRQTYLLQNYVRINLCDAWTWWIVGLFGWPASRCMSCVRAPWTWGLFMCFCALFSLLNVEGVYNDHSLCCNCNSLTSHLPNERVSPWGGPAWTSPLYHYGFEAGTASQRLRRCYLPLRRGHAVRAALAVCACSAQTMIRTFLTPVCGLLCTIACTAAEQAHWTVPTRWDGRCGRPVRADSRRRALGDVGGAIAHGRCTASRGITRCALVTSEWPSSITNPSANARESPRKVWNAIWAFESLMWHNLGQHHAQDEAGRPVWCCSIVPSVPATSARSQWTCEPAIGVWRLGRSVEWRLDCVLSLLHLPFCVIDRSSVQDYEIQL